MNPAHNSDFVSLYGTLLNFPSASKAVVFQYLSSWPQIPTAPHLPPESGEHDRYAALG